MQSVRSGNIDMIIKAYLSSLGFADAHLPLLIAAGPIAGFLVPPLVSVWSDASRSRLGRRKPFIAVGGLGCVGSVLCLALSRELAGLRTVNTDIMANARNIAAVSICALNISMQPLQLGLRAAIIDHFTPKEQPLANLWISRLSSFGSVFVTAIAYSYDLNFRDICTVSIFVLIVLVATTLIMTPHNYEGYGQLEKGRSFSLTAHLRKLVMTWRNLPPITWRVCRAQLLCWFTWFLLLHYTSM